MRATALATIVLLAAGCVAGSGATGDIPQPARIAPDRGFASQPTPIVISGEGFAGLASQPSGGGSPVVDTKHRAWLDDTELADVAWIDSATLRATVPAGLPLGAHALIVEGPSGERGTLPAAFTVLATPALTVAAAADPPSVRVGQAFTVTVTVRNGGAADLSSLFVAAPALTTGNGAAVALTAGPSPSPPPTLAAGQDVVVRWTYQATTAGIVSVATSATATDPGSGAALSVSAPAVLVTVQDVAATLTAAVVSPPTPSAARTGQAFDAAVAFTNAATADLPHFTVASPAVSSLDPARVTITGPTATPPATLAAGQTVTVTWHVTSAVAGTLGLGFSASGVDGAGHTVTGSAQATIAVAAPPALSAVLTTTPAPPATVDVSQTAAVTLAVTNAGGGAARITGVTPSVSPGASASCQPSAPPATPVAPVTVAPGATQRFNWTCAASTAGTYTLGAAVAASDPATGGALAVSVPGVALGFTRRLAVTVAIRGDGTGTVTSSPAGVGPCGNGGTACSATFDTGAQVTLTASPLGGSTLTWAGCDRNPTASTCRIDQLTSDRTVTATFSAPRPTLTVSVGGGKNGSVSSSPAGIASCSRTGGTCSAAFASGTRVVLTASPSGNARTAWGSGCDSTTTNTCTVQSLTAARSVTVNFN